MGMVATGGGTPTTNNNFEEYLYPSHLDLTFAIFFSYKYIELTIKRKYKRINTVAETTLLAAPSATETRATTYNFIVKTRKARFYKYQYLKKQVTFLRHHQNKQM